MKYLGSKSLFIITLMSFLLSFTSIFYFIEATSLQNKGNADSSFDAFRYSIYDRFCLSDILTSEDLISIFCAATDRPRIKPGATSEFLLFLHKFLSNYSSFAASYKNGYREEDEEGQKRAEAILRTYPENYPMIRDFANKLTEEDSYGSLPTLERIAIEEIIHRSDVNAADSSVVKGRINILAKGIMDRDQRINSLTGSSHSYTVWGLRSSVIFGVIGLLSLVVAYRTNRRNEKKARKASADSPTQ